jgi:hypothetical protein
LTLLPSAAKMAKVIKPYCNSDPFSGEAQPTPLARNAPNSTLPVNTVTRRDDIGIQE